MRHNHHSGSGQPGSCGRDQDAAQEECSRWPWQDWTPLPTLNPYKMAVQLATGPSSLTKVEMEGMTQGSSPTEFEKHTTSLPK